MIVTPPVVAEPAHPALTATLAPLWFSRYRLRIRPARPMALPLWGRGAILRGALGLAFRRLVCHDMALDCRACPLRPDCPYPEVFDAAPRPGSDRLRNFADIPRPFVFNPPTDTKTLFSPEDSLTFGLMLVGKASRHITYLVAAFQSLAEQGMGPKRARFRLEVVEAIDGSGRCVGVFRAGSAFMSPISPQVRASHLMKDADGTRMRLPLHFLTPTDLKDQGHAVLRPDFGPLIRRLRDRASALAAFFGDGPLQLDFKGIAEAADTVRLTDHNTRRLDMDRRSTRTGQRHDIGGFVGQARYEGAAIGPLMPLIRLGEVIHAGKHAAFGNGWYEVVDE